VISWLEITGLQCRIKHYYNFIRSFISISLIINKNIVYSFILCYSSKQMYVSLGVVIKCTRLNRIKSNVLLKIKSNNLQSGRYILCSMFIFQIKIFFRSFSNCIPNFSFSLLSLLPCVDRFQSNNILLYV